MKSFVDKLNLKSSELRFLGFVAFVVFALLNVWLVWPHFSEWTTVQGEIGKARKQLKDWQAKVDRRSQQMAVMERLEKQGPPPLVEGQAGNLLASIQSHLRMNNVIERSSRQAPPNPNAPTNQFFEEYGYTFTIGATNEALINLLMDLASPNSMIRVREMKLDRDNTMGGTLLSGQLRIVGSYVKKAPTPPPATTPPTLASKAATNRGATNRGATNPVSKAAAPTRKP